MNLKRKAKIYIAITLLIISGILYFGYKEIYKPHPSIHELASAFDGLSADFQEEVMNSSAQYQGQVVTLSGVITDLTAVDVTLNGNTFCQIDSSLTVEHLSVDGIVKLKGRFIGYDDLLEEVKLNNCIIITD